MTRRLQRICFLTDAPQFGGAERYIVDMCGAARQRSIEAHVHQIGSAGRDAPARASSKDASSFLQTTLRRHEFSVSQQHGCSIRGVRRMLRRERPDAVVINASARSGMWRMPWVCRSIGVPSAWIHHMIDPVDPRRLGARRLNGRVQGLSLWRLPQALRHRLAAGGATIVIASNDEDAAYLQRWGLAPRSKLRVISPGIDPNRWVFDPGNGREPRRQWLPRCEEPAFVVGTATRLVDGKGIEALIDATARLAKENKRFALLIAGTGPRQDDLERIVRDRGLDGHVRLLGFVERMAEFYSAIDVFALCSMTESFGLALTEAMACGRAVLATPTNGAMRQIRHRKTGIIMTGFSSECIAAGLRELRNDRALRERLAKRARPVALADFTIDRTLDATLNALTQAGVGFRASPRASTLIMPEQVGKVPA